MPPLLAPNSGLDGPPLTGVVAEDLVTNRADLRT